MDIGKLLGGITGAARKPSSGGQQADFLRMKANGTYIVRHYRYVQADGEVGFCAKDEKIWYHKKPIRQGSPIWNQIEIERRALFEADNKDAAKELFPRESYFFPVVAISSPAGDGPDSFKLLEYSQGQFKKLCLAMARSEGYVGTIPTEPDEEDQSDEAVTARENLAAFFKRVEEAQQKITGPEGYDIAIIKDNTQAEMSNYYTIQLIPKNDKTLVLAFPEDEKVPNPELFLERMRAKAREG